MNDVPRADAARPRHGVGLAEATRVWLRIALLSFGGPAGQIAVMHRILVEEKRWIGEQRFLHALNFCMLLPGPEAQQLATYVGWLLHRTVGGLIAGLLFVLPGVVAIMALSWLYVLYGQVPLVEALFFGLKAAVLAIVLQALARIGRRSLRNGALRSLAIAAFVLIYVFAVPFPLIVLGAGLIGYLGARFGLPAFTGGGGHHGSHGSTVVADADSLLGEESHAGAAPRAPTVLRTAATWLAIWLVPVALLWLVLGADDVFTQIAGFFSVMAVVTFGGAYAVLAYVAQAAVATYGWLEPGEMLDGLGMAETTPGPLIMVLQFVAFLGAFREATGLSPLVAGTLGGLLATWVTFAPCFLWIFVGAPYIERLRGNRALSGALTAITGAVVGVILNLALWFAVHTVFHEVRLIDTGPLHVELPVPASVDPWALLLSALAILAVFRLGLGIFPVLAGAAAAGIALHLAGLTA